MRKMNLLIIMIIMTLPISKSTARPSQDWPYSIPCRVKDGVNKDLLIMTLGDVETPLADGTFDPSKDQITLSSGEITEHYYRDALGIQCFTPIDKTHFPVSPSGWCTWYYYYPRINEDEVKQNARWIADNLKDYGAQYVQIDDGWQGDGGEYTERDWNRIRQNQFPSGMKPLADYIKSLGLTPGIWIAPHGQTDPEFTKANPETFLFKPDGTSASETWEGKFLMDPTTPESEKYFTHLFQMMCEWGYEYFKIDGQPIVVDEYKKKKEFMKHPSDDNVQLYRNTLETIRDTIGQERYLLGCWGMPVEGIGIMNGSRTMGDIVLGWEGGFMLAMRATLRDYYLHNIAWYNDPDVFILRSPLPYPQAQAWATIQGLTGVALMGTDRLDDLSEPRVELMRRIYPAVDIRSLDLFKVENDKRIWDLKINHLNRQYDVVGLFNYDQNKRDPMYIKWAELGLPEDKPVHAYDFWNQDYLGAWEVGMMIDVDPTSCRVLSFLPDNGQIQLISTNRHITQGWVDLKKTQFDSGTNTYTGTSAVIANDPYRLRFVFPKGKNYKIKSASAKIGWQKLPIKISNHQGWAEVQIASKKTKDVKWKIIFEPAEFFHYPTRNPENVEFKKVASDEVQVIWKEEYWLNNGYYVYLDGKLLGYTPRGMFPIKGLEAGKKYTVEIETTWEDGTVSAKKSKLEFTLD